MKIEVQGLDRLIKGFKTVGSAQKVNAVVSKTLEQGAIKIQEQAKEDCPVGMGKLRGSIFAEKIPEGYAVGTNVDYGVYVEFGAGTHGMKPRPFLLPAFNKYKDTIPQEIRVNLSKALKEAIRHG